MTEMIQVGESKWMLMHSASTNANAFTGPLYLPEPVEAWADFVTANEASQLKALSLVSKFPHSSTVQSMPTRDNPERKGIVRAIKLAFFLGVLFVVGMIVGTYWSGLWIGLLFVPGIVGAYGLFLSSGMQLSEIDRESGDS